MYIQIFRLCIYEYMWTTNLQQSDLRCLVSVGAFRIEREDELDDTNIYSMFAYVYIYTYLDCVHAYIYIQYTCSRVTSDGKSGSARSSLSKRTNDDDTYVHCVFACVCVYTSQLCILYILYLQQSDLRGPEPIGAFRIERENTLDDINIYSIFAYVYTYIQIVCMQIYVVQTCSNVTSEAQSLSARSGLSERTNSTRSPTAGSCVAPDISEACVNGGGVNEQALVCLSNREMVDASRRRPFHCKMTNNRLKPFFFKLCRPNVFSHLAAFNDNGLWFPSLHVSRSVLLQ